MNSFEMLECNIERRFESIQIYGICVILANWAENIRFFYEKINKIKMFLSYHSNISPRTLFYFYKVLGMCYKDYSFH